MRYRIATSAASVCIVAPSSVLAHPDLGNTIGFAHGLLHPITGIDHVLAMVMVGMLAYQLGGRAIWLVPVTFVAIMAIGGFIGAAGIGVPLVELGIALSVIVLGLVVALGVRAPAMALVGFFATFHGHAHGTEMPVSANGLADGVGFVLATALLHLAGLAAGYLIGRIAEVYSPPVVRSAGGIVAIAGLGILVGIV